jgi:hypothetical protein
MDTSDLASFRRAIELIQTPLQTVVMNACGMKRWLSELARRNPHLVDQADFFADFADPQIQGHAFEAVHRFLR